MLSARQVGCALGSWGVSCLNMSRVYKLQLTKAAVAEALRLGHGGLPAMEQTPDYHSEEAGCALLSNQPWPVRSVPFGMKRNSTRYGVHLKALHRAAST